MKIINKIYQLLATNKNNPKAVIFARISDESQEKSRIKQQIAGLEQLISFNEVSKFHNEVVSERIKAGIRLKKMRQVSK